MNLGDSRGKKRSLLMQLALAVGNLRSVSSNEVEQHLHPDAPGWHYKFPPELSQVSPLSFGSYSIAPSLILHFVVLNILSTSFLFANILLPLIPLHSAHGAGGVQAVCSGTGPRQRSPSGSLLLGREGLWVSFQPPSLSPYLSPPSFLCCLMGSALLLKAGEAQEDRMRNFPEAPPPLLTLSRARKPPMWEICDGQFLTLSM